jgi:hypothetical protein
MEHAQLVLIDPDEPPKKPEPVADWCAYCFAPAEEGPVVNGRRYCSGAHARRDAAKRADAE